MPAPDFLRQALRGSSRRFELVHVESGAVLASRVSLGRSERLRLRSRRPALPAPGRETVLVVAPSRSLHTFFAPSPIDAAFVGPDGTILGTRRDMKPWRVALALGSCAVIEAASGFLERSNLQIGDRVTLREAQSARPAREVPSARDGLEEVPESARSAVRAAVPDALGDFDAEADPWHIPSLESPPSLVMIRGEGLAYFEAERPVGPGPAAREPAVPAPRATARPPRHAVSARGVSLAQLVARRTPMEWFEGVAIVQGLCAVLLGGASAAGPGVPEAEEVAITPEGGVELLADGSREAPVARVARLLHGLVEGTALPVQLRLLVLQELSPSPGCASVLEFSTRLALFERPGRETLIRGVYERFIRLPPREAESLAPVTQPAKPRPVEPQAWWRQRAVRGAAAAALLVVALGLMLAWVRSSVAPPAPGAVDHRGPVARDVAAAVGSVSGAAAGSARAVAQWLGVAATDRSSAAVPSDALGTAAPSDALGTAAPSNALGTAAPSAMEPATSSRIRTPNPAPPTPAGESGGRVPADPALPDSNVYSAADAAVAPPALVRTRLPATPIPSVSADQLPEVEVVVSPAGEVESVKLLTPPAGVGPTMMLSAIKNWRFHPATRDGQPVRYRLIIRLTNR
jgi:hypothetical protein